MKSPQPVGIGILGGGLMGRELASSIARFFVLDGPPVAPVLKGVCDLNEAALAWFATIPSVSLLTRDYEEFLKDPAIEIVYLALPHSLHRDYALRALRAGKDLLMEKPFGVDLEAAQEITEEARMLGRFVRCNSELPYFPGGQRVFHAARQGQFGRLIEVRAGFLHSSDLDPDKPVNWKRQSAICGEAGVMADLGMHVLHLPLRLGWRPRRVFARLQKIYEERPDGRGGRAPSDTWDNATLLADFLYEDREVPMMLEMKRLAPGETNTWYIEVLGTDGGIRFSTKEPKTLWTFERTGGEQRWHRVDLGFQTAFRTSTGQIFEPGFPDCFVQMLAAFLAERSGVLGDRLGCVTPEEAITAHEIYAAALQSQALQAAVELTQPARAGTTLVS